MLSSWHTAAAAQNNVRLHTQSMWLDDLWDPWAPECLSYPDWIPSTPIRCWPLFIWTDPSYQVCQFCLLLAPQFHSALVVHMSVFSCLLLMSLNPTLWEPTQRSDLSVQAQYCVYYGQNKCIVLWRALALGCKIQTTVYSFYSNSHKKLTIT